MNDTRLDKLESVVKELGNQLTELRECLREQGWHVSYRALDEARGRQPGPLHHIDVTVEPLPGRDEIREAKG